MGEQHEAVGSSNHIHSGERNRTNNEGCEKTAEDRRETQNL